MEAREGVWSSKNRLARGVATGLVVRAYRRGRGPGSSDCSYPAKFVAQAGYDAALPRLVHAKRDRLRAIAAPLLANSPVARGWSSAARCTRGTAGLVGELTRGPDARRAASLSRSPSLPLSLSPSLPLSLSPSLPLSLSPSLPLPLSLSHSLSPSLPPSHTHPLTLSLSPSRGPDAGCTSGMEGAGAAGREGWGLVGRPQGLQGYLAHKKHHPPPMTTIGP